MESSRPQWRAAARLILGTVLMAAVVAGCTPTSASPSRTYIRFAPSAVDPANTLSPELRSYAGEPIGASRNRLVVLFGGTGGSAQSLAAMATELQHEGFHVLGVTYDSSLGTLQACPDNQAAADPDCHRSYRSEVVFGEGVQDPTGTAHDHPGTTVSAADSALNSLMRHIEYADFILPGADFGQFLHREGGVCVAESAIYQTCEPLWENISLMGFSQGGGVALYLSKFFPVARVGALSAPFDTYGPKSAPSVAPWVAEGGFATPTDRMTSLVHAQESNIWRLRAGAEALGLQGPEVIVRNATAPFGGSGRLVSDYTPGCTPVDSVAYHNASATNSCADVERLSEVWVHMVG